MNTFTPSEERVLRIFAINRNAGDMKGYLGRVFMPFLGERAKLAGLIILGIKGKALNKAASRFPKKIEKEVRRFCVETIVEADSALEELDQRVSGTVSPVHAPATQF